MILLGNASLYRGCVRLAEEEVRVFSRVLGKVRLSGHVPLSGADGCPTLGLRRGGGRRAAPIPTTLSVEPDNSAKLSLFANWHESKTTLTYSILAERGEVSVLARPFGISSL